jgi:branched-chain amino acid transport system ATP-binding protein
VSLLEVSGVVMRFGGVVALEGPSFSVEEGAICGLIGPNGAGKTTLFNCVSRLYTPQEGAIRFAGEDLLARRAHDIAGLGIARTFQNLALIHALTVRDNVMLGAHHRSRAGFVASALSLPSERREEREVREQADEALERLGLAAVADRPAGGLPYGTLKRVEIATVLATDPEVLLLDEPSSGMGPEEAQQLGDTLLDLRRDFALSILMIEHHVPLVVRVCDYVYCLDFGQLVTSGLPDDVRRHPQVVAAYLGEDPDPAVVALEAQLDALVDGG